MSTVLHSLSEPLPSSVSHGFPDESAGLSSNSGGVKEPAAAGRPPGRKLVERRCQFDRCPNPTKSHHFYVIDETSKGGEKDWSGLVGKTLCSSCYNHYRKCGHLERERRDHSSKGKDVGGETVTEGADFKKGAERSQQHCEYDKCEAPLNSSKYYTVNSSYKAGDQNWEPLTGKTICHACYRQYKRRGTLERAVGRKLGAEEQRCTNTLCDNPDADTRFFIIDSKFKAGNQDWASLIGQVLCHACYSRYRQRGTLKRASGKTKRKMPDLGGSMSDPQSVMQTVVGGMVHAAMGVGGEAVSQSVGAGSSSSVTLTDAALVDGGLAGPSHAGESMGGVKDDSDGGVPPEKQARTLE